MNKPIIIDDVDVSGCEYRTDIHKCLLADGKIKIFENYCQICNDGCYAIDCYYKQLQRLKAENEKLKTDIKEIGERMTFLNADRCRQIMVYELSLKEIRGIVSEPCIESEEDCNSCNSNCMNKDILKIINEVLKDV